jgi:hypothetical protein
MLHAYLLEMETGEWSEINLSPCSRRLSYSGLKSKEFDLVLPGQNIRKEGEIKHGPQRQGGSGKRPNPPSTSHEKNLTSDIPKDTLPQN